MGRRTMVGDNGLGGVCDRETLCEVPGRYEIANRAISLWVEQRVSEEMNPCDPTPKRKIGRGLHGPHGARPIGYQKALRCARDFVARCCIGVPDDSAP